MSQAKSANVAGIGSVLESFVGPHENTHDTIVWGSGFVKRPIADSSVSRKTYVTSVRGKLSAKYLSGFKGTLGDPALLIAKYFSPTFDEKKQNKIGVIPHYADKENEAIFKLINSSESFVLIDVERPMAQVINEIAQMKVVISSSLHGLIIADSFGIPNFWVSVSDNVAGSGFKFLDYFSGVGRSEEEVLVDLDSLTENSILQMAKRWKPVTDLKIIQTNLENALYEGVSWLDMKSQTAIQERVNILSEWDLNELDDGVYKFYTGDLNLMRLAGTVDSDRFRILLTRVRDAGGKFIGMKRGFSYFKIGSVPEKVHYLNPLGGYLGIKIWLRFLKRFVYTTTRRNNG